MSIKFTGKIEIDDETEGTWQFPLPIKPQLTYHGKEKLARGELAKKGAVGEFRLEIKEIKEGAAHVEVSIFLEDKSAVVIFDGWVQNRSMLHIADLDRPFHITLC